MSRLVITVTDIPKQYAKTLQNDIRKLSASYSLIESNFPCWSFYNSNKLYFYYSGMSNCNDFKYLDFNDFEEQVLIYAAIFRNANSSGKNVCINVVP